ncbi:Aste57867_11611 [Aphanomyces stellatus]|uniref:Aste57867_11611 protein n=1 Tax=Aphanomyces stellatus TaxID=120398 RepID=A0A485KTF9_9STRA|nr:hypothetical protein As57867_011568 [Aphanomyces stellatus]VFT88469.1 Aste57867_11611 [Aphanomyces stellatus]
MGSAFSRPAITAVGVLYPAYASFKALETAQVDDDKQWLTYWVVFSITSSAEEVAEQVVSYLPGYYVAKFVFLVWLMLPKTRGAITVYNQVIAPMLKKYEPVIDDKLRLLRAYVENWIEDMKLNGAKYIGQGIAAAMETAKQVQEQANSSPLKAQVVARIQDIQQASMRHLKKGAKKQVATEDDEPTRHAEMVSTE